MLLANDFERLVAAFWRMADEHQVSRMKGLAEDAFRGVATNHAALAITRAIQECEKPPAWAALRRMAQDAQGPTAYGGGKIVACIGKDGRKCGTLFPMWTMCPSCYPSQSGPLLEREIWPQSSESTVEAWEARSHSSAETWDEQHARAAASDAEMKKPSPS